MPFIITYTMLTGKAVRIAHSAEEAQEAMAALKSAGAGPVTVEYEDATGRREPIGSLTLGQQQSHSATSPSLPTVKRPADRRIDPSSHSVSLADARREDCPLIYVNRGFEFLTGYTREECIGLNCRLLQGAATNPLAIAQMRHAIALGKPLLIDVLNYRKDGSEFWMSNGVED